MNTTEPPPAVPRRASPVGQTLLIVGILLAGLVAGVFILRAGKPTAAAHDEHAEKEEHRHEEGEHHGGAKRVELTPEQRRHAELGIETAGPARIRVGLRLFGKIIPDEEKLAHVSPRYAGIVRRVNKRLGESVRAGDVLATVESNESLQPYDLKAPLAGTIIERSVTVGEFAGTDKSLFTVADLGTVWVDFQVYQQDFARLRVGQAVEVAAGRRGAEQADPAEGSAHAEPTVSSTVAYLSPFGAETTQTMLARAHVPNEKGALRPGLFVTGEVAVGDSEAALAVREAAVQTLDGKEVVFVEEGDGFEARAVEIGKRDAQWAEIVAGLKPGDRYVAANAFLLKAELGKEGAEHED